MSVGDEFRTTVRYPGDLLQRIQRLMEQDKAARRISQTTRLNAYAMDLLTRAVAEEEHKRSGVADHSVNLPSNRPTK